MTIQTPHVGIIYGPYTSDQTVNRFNQKSKTFYLTFPGLDKKPIIKFLIEGSGFTADKVSDNDYKRVAAIFENAYFMGTVTISDDKALVISNGEGNFSGRDKCLKQYNIKPEEYNKNSLWALHQILYNELGAIFDDGDK